MAYTPPNRQNLEFVLDDNYTPPDRQNLQFIMAEDVTITELSCPSFMSTAGISCGLLWYTQLQPLIATSSLQSTISVQVAPPALISSGALRATTQVRMRSVPFRSKGTLSIVNVSQLPENTEAVSPWPFRSKGVLQKPAMAVVITATFRGKSRLEIPVIAVDGSSVFSIPPFISRSAAVSDIQISLQTPSFKSKGRLEVLAVNMMPEGDYYIAIPKLIGKSRLSSDVAITIEPIDFGSHGALSSDLYVGKVLEDITFASNSVLSCGIITPIVQLVPLKSKGSLASDVSINMSVPAFVSAGSLACEIFTGRFITLPQFRGRGKISVGMGFDLFIPPFVSHSRLNANIVACVITPPLVSYSGISCNIEMFSIEYADVGYFCTLTGAENGLTDLEIPMVSLQFRRSTSSTTYALISTPGEALAGEIAKRRDGNLNIYKGYLRNEQVLRKELIVSVSLETIRRDKGTESVSISLSGHATEEYIQKEVILTGVSVITEINGELRYRFAEPSMDLNPGDTLHVMKDSFTVESMSVYCRADKTGITQMMEVSGV